MVLLCMLSWQETASGMAEEEMGGQQRKRARTWGAVETETHFDSDIDSDDAVDAPMGAASLGQRFRGRTATCLCMCV